ncbi:MAG: phosphoglycerate dehydrogenase [Myxococcota bacterium]
MHRVLITGKLAQVALDLFASAPDVEVVYKPDLPYPQLLELVDGFDCLISRSETPIPRELIDRATRLKVIARAAVGVGNIDIEYATERGILVLNTPGMNTNSAAELTLGLLLAVQRKIVLAHNNMASEGWDRHRFSGWELRGKTIGIIGLGNVGHRVARFARGFEMKVLAYDPYIADRVFELHGAQKVTLEQLCREADVITVHVPKTRETSGMLAKQQLDWMKQGVILLNAARGGVIDEAVLLEGLQSGKVRGAGVDTWMVEPPVDNPFRHLSNVVMTPHIGASTVEAQYLIGKTVAEQSIRALRGEVVDYPVNMPQMRVLEGSSSRYYTVLSEQLGRFAAQYVGFSPSQLDVMHRGKFDENDVRLIRLAFLKGYLQASSDELITYVNAERKAQQRGLGVRVHSDSVLDGYENGVRFRLSGGQQQMQVGGVVFGENQMRLTRLNDYIFEMEPRGTLLVTINKDQPGMIGVIGTVLGKHDVNIDEFELARNRPGGEAMALIRVDSDASELALSELRARPGMTGVKRIRL